MRDLYKLILVIIAMIILWMALGGKVYAQLPRPSGGSGSSSSISSTSGTYAALPGTCSAGDLYFASDSFYDNPMRCTTGNVWQHSLFGKIVTPPVLGDFTARNSASGVTTSGGVQITAAANASNDWKMYTKAEPATPYTITMAYKVTLNLTNNFPYAGFVWYDDGGSFVTHGRQTTSSPSQNTFLSITKWTNFSTISANYTLSIPQGYLSNYIICAEDDGSNRKVYYSEDGKNFMLFHSIGNTDFANMDHVGFGVNSANATYAATIVVLAWKQGTACGL